MGRVIVTRSRRGRRSCRGPRLIGRVEREERNRPAVLLERDCQGGEARLRRIGRNNERACLADGPSGLFDANDRQRFPAGHDEEGARADDQQQSRVREAIACRD